MSRVEFLWLQYRIAVVPLDAPAVQLTECRRAFYAGIHALLTELQIMFDPSAEATDEDIRKIELIRLELVRFKDRVKAGLA